MKSDNHFMRNLTAKNERKLCSQCIYFNCLELNLALAMEKSLFGALIAVALLVDQLTYLPIMLMRKNNTPEKYSVRSLTINLVSM